MTRCFLFVRFIICGQILIFIYIKMWFICNAVSCYIKLLALFIKGKQASNEKIFLFYCWPTNTAEPSSSFCVNLVVSVFAGPGPAGKSQVALKSNGLIMFVFPTELWRFVRGALRMGHDNKVCVCVFAVYGCVCMWEILPPQIRHGPSRDLCAQRKTVKHQHAHRALL